MVVRHLQSFNANISHMSNSYLLNLVHCIWGEGRISNGVYRACQRGIKQISEPNKETLLELYHTYRQSCNVNWEGHITHLKTKSFNNNYCAGKADLINMQFQSSCQYTPFSTAPMRSIYQLLQSYLYAEIFLIVEIIQDNDNRGKIQYWFNLFNIE